jgi:integrase
LLFLYKHVLRTEIGLVHGAARAKERHRLPVVLTRDEVASVLSKMEGSHRLMAEILYGSGLRSIECCRLRVHDIDLNYGEIVVRAGKGGKDRRTMLARRLIPALNRQIEHVRKERDRDLVRGCGGVSLPYALASCWVTTRSRRPRSTATCSNLGGRGVVSPADKLMDMP